MLQIEEVCAMPERLQLGGHGSHDRDNESVFKFRINGTQAISAQHYSSHIRSRVRSSAAGCKLLSASVCARRIRLRTVSAESRKEYGIPSARNIASVTFPPCVCHGSRSPNVPR